MILYLCRSCGAWAISLGIAEVFGTLSTPPSQFVQQCACGAAMQPVDQAARLTMTSVIASAPPGEECLTPLREAVAFHAQRLPHSDRPLVVYGAAATAPYDMLQQAFEVIRRYYAAAAALLAGATPGEARNEEARHADEP